MIELFKRLTRTPSAAEMLQRQLDEAERERTLVSMERERFVHSEVMLVERIERIKIELKEIKA